MMQTRTMFIWATRQAISMNMFTVLLSYTAPVFIIRHGGATFITPGHIPGDSGCVIIPGGDGPSAWALATDGLTSALAEASGVAGTEAGGDRPYITRPIVGMEEAGLATQPAIMVTV